MTFSTAELARIEKYDALIDDVRNGRGIDRDLDAMVHQMMELEGEAPAYTSVMDAAITLIPRGWWWHVSHLDASVIPNTPAKGIPISNAMDYEKGIFGGRPVNYSASSWGDDRLQLPRTITAAALTAQRGLYLKALAIELGRKIVVQTGDGPMSARPEDGLLEPIPYDCRVIGQRIISDKEYEAMMRASCEDDERPETDL